MSETLDEATAVCECIRLSSCYECSSCVVDATTKKVEDIQVSSSNRLKICS